MDCILRLFVYGIGAWVSVKYATGYWVVGPVFGMVVVYYDSERFRKFAAGRHLAFLAASTLIYALVYGVASAKWEWSSDSLNYFLGPLPAGVFLGSILLPLSHQIILKRSPKATLRTMTWLTLSFYLVMLLAFADERLSLKLHFNFIALSVVLWQALYLISEAYLPDNAS
jgi:hypothetical protein